MCLKRKFWFNLSRKLTYQDELTLRETIVSQFLTIVKFMRGQTTQIIEIVFLLAVTSSLNDLKRLF